MSPEHISAEQINEKEKQQTACSGLISTESTL